MAERHRSKDGVRETEKFVQGDTPSQQGRADGELQRKVGTRDLLKQVEKGEGNTITRVRKSDKVEENDNG